MCVVQVDQVCVAFLCASTRHAKSGVSHLRRHSRNFLISARTVLWMPRIFVWTPELHPRFCVFQSFIPKDFLDFGAPSADRPSKAVFSRVYFLNAVTYVLVHYLESMAMINLS